MVQDLFYELFPVFGRGKAGVTFEYAVEVGYRVETAFDTDLDHIHRVFDQ